MQILYLWIGELGREIWVARSEVNWLLAQGHEVTVATHKGSIGLYPCKTIDNGIKERCSRKYADGRYTVPEEYKNHTFVSSVDSRNELKGVKRIFKPLMGKVRTRKVVLFHGRCMEGNKQGKNWFTSYDRHITKFLDYKRCSIGLKSDLHLPYTYDRRGLPLWQLILLISGSEFVVAPEGGIAVLSLYCKTPVYTFTSRAVKVLNEERWNPFGAPVVGLV